MSHHRDVNALFTDPGWRMAVGLGRLVVDHRPALAVQQQDSLFGADSTAGGRYDRHAAVAVFSPDRRHRYLLTRVWDPRTPPLVAVMLNPSTADAFQLDPTLRRVHDYARTWGNGGMVILNLFAYRSTQPAGLLTDGLDPVGEDNDRVITTVLNATVQGTVLVGWGAQPKVYRTVGDRPTQVLALLDRAGVTPYCLAVTAAGYPVHPLYQRADATPQPYLPQAETAQVEETAHA